MRYIDADKLIREFSGGEEMKSMSESIADERFIRVIKNQPTADVEEVKHGEWVISSDGYYPFCSNCRYEPPFIIGKDMRTPICPKCGAKMDGGKAE